MQRIKDLWNKSTGGKLAIGCLGFIIIICICSILVLALPNSPDAPSAQNPDVVITEPVLPTEETVNEETVAPTLIPEPTATQSLPELGTSRANPAPLGVEIVQKNFNFIVNEVTRPADAIIKEGNMFNSDPEPGNEFVMVQITIVCTKESSEKCNISPYDFTASGSVGIVRDANAFLAGVPNMLESTEFFGGATVTGKLVFEVGQDETNIIMTYEPLFSFTEAHFLLPDKAQ